MPKDDLRERFDLCDEDGRPLGLSKPRGLVHRDGDWHRSVHIWVVLDGDRVVLQRRSLTKDTHPGELDVSVTGHLRAGETVEDAFREAKEEIGLELRPEDLERIGVRRRVDDRRPLAFDREVQDVFWTRTRVPLESLRPDPDEVSGLVAVGVRELLDLVSGRASSGGFARAELVPDPDGYYAVALRSIALRLEGKAAPPWRLG